MPIVRLGNPAAIDHPNDNAVLDEPQVTTIHVPEHDSHMQRMRNITHADGLWVRISAADAPSWVASDDPKLEAALAAYWDCPAGERAPDDISGVEDLAPAFDQGADS